MRVRFQLHSLPVLLAAAGAAGFAPPAWAGPTPDCIAGASADSTECGTDSTTIGTGATALGDDAGVFGDNSTAVGASSGAVSLLGGATAVGSQANASGENSTAVGYGAGVGSLLPGDIFPTPATGGTAVGAAALVTANATNGTAIGFQANAGFANSTAIGAGSATQREGQVMLGGTGTSVTVGDIAASTAAQSGEVALMTVDANGTVGRDTAILTGINSAITTLQTSSAEQAGRVTTLEQGQASLSTQINVLQGANVAQAARISAVEAANAQQAAQIAALQDSQAALFDLANVNRRDIRKANEGVAMALAMESPALPSGTRFALSGGVGYFQGRTAATTAVSARVGTYSSVSAGVGVGLDSGEVGARAGFQVAW